MKPIHKFNGGLGATLCNSCSVVISTGLTEDLYCEKCKQKNLLIELMEADEKDGLYKTNTMSQQTAVDYLIEQLQAPCRGIPTHIIEQSKQMEKEQIIDAHIEGQRVFDKHPHTQWTNDQAEQYYNETYNK